MSGRKKGLSDAASLNYLYAGEVSDDGRGRHQNTLSSLAISRVKKTRAVPAEIGLPPEHAAVSLIAAKEAILRCLPATEADALTQSKFARPNRKLSDGGQYAETLSPFRGLLTVAALPMSTDDRPPACPRFELVNGPTEQV